MPTTFPLRFATLLGLFAWFPYAFAGESAEPYAASPPLRWDFNQTGNRQGWTTPTELRGAVLGGSMWLSLAPLTLDAARIASYAYQANGDFDSVTERNSEPVLVLATSPDGLHSRSDQIRRVRLRVWNLSSLTDLLVRWKTLEGGWGPEVGEYDFGQPVQSQRCTLESYRKEWQVLDCYVGTSSQQTIDGIALLSAQNMVHGDLWIDWIEVDGTPPPTTRIGKRPDVSSEAVVPAVSIPGISQEGFSEAFHVLDRCLTVDVPLYGFKYPLMTPGGFYTKGGWYQLDAVLALVGAKWVNQAFAENVIRGFIELQAENPDGRIDLRGQNGIRGQVADLAVLPKYFEVAFDIARRTDDGALRRQIYDSMRLYLEWWLSPAKRDPSTGLISGMFEETFGDLADAWHVQDRPLPGPMTVAPADLNVAVAVGADLTSKLAADLGEAADATKYRRICAELSRAINSYLWDERTGAYYSYDLRDRKPRRGLIVSTFDPLRLGIAPAANRHRLLKRLRDPKQFNWGRVPLTSWAMFEAVMKTGGYGFYGDIWTLRNMTVVQGLEESGFHDVAAELNWATIKEFHSKYWESLDPARGEGRGAENYAWSASQYIGAIIEHLFGVNFDRRAQVLSIVPHVPAALYGKDVSLRRLLLPTGEETRLFMTINQSAPHSAKVAVRIEGPLPKGSLVVALPGDSRQYRIPVQRSFNARFP